MFDEGFGPDVDQLFDCILQRTQVALFSATIPEWVQKMTARHLHDPVIVKMEVNAQPVDTVNHRVIDVPEGKKVEVLEELLRLDGTCVVFCRTKDGVERLANSLSSHRFDVASLRGNMNQPDRERVMRAFRVGRPRILVATNVAARGLDVSHIARVINYDLPDSPELLTHRLGRTGRMGRSGEAVTLVGPRERKRWAAMSERLKLTVVPERWTGPVESAARPTPEPRQPSPETRKPRSASMFNGQNGGGNRPDSSRRPSRGRLDQRPLVAASCEGCGAAVKVPFTPTAIRPAYCKECRDLVSIAV